MKIINLPNFQKIEQTESKSAIDELITKLQSSTPILTDILRSNAAKEAESIACALQNDLIF